MNEMLLRALASIALMLFAAAPDAGTIVHDLEARYRHAQTLKATFFESYSESGSHRIAESGTVYFSHPGRMRWEYESPQTKLFLVDGANAWFYVPADHTASRAKVRESSDWRTPIALLAGKANLGDLCRQVRLLDPSEASKPEEKPLAPEDSVLRCDPKGESGQNGLHAVFLEVDAQSYLVRVVIDQAAGIETEFRFGNWQENIPLSEAQFHFQPPAGVSVVDEGALSDEIH
jgi:outer membrane lipoprotein carrier protein